VSAGLPGLGLGGLFFIVSALLGPFVELRRSIRGESDRASWRRAGRQFFLAAAMIAAIDGTLRLAYLGLEAGGIAQQPSQALPTVLPLAPIAITGALLTAVLIAAKCMQVLSVARSRGGGAIPAGRVRTLTAGAAVTAGWSALLLVGASELSPLAPPDRAPETGGNASVAIREAPGADLVAATHLPVGATDTRRQADPQADTTDSPSSVSSVDPAGSSSGTAAPAATTPADPQPALSAGEPTSSAGDTGQGSPDAAAETPPSQGPPPDAGPPAWAEPPPHSAAGGQPEPPGQDHQALAGTRNSTRVPPGRS
jgi:hypothetical protein